MPLSDHMEGRLVFIAFSIFAVWIVLFLLFVLVPLMFLGTNAPGIELKAAPVGAIAPAMWPAFVTIFGAT